MDRHVRALGREPHVGVDDEARVGILDRDHVIAETERIDHAAVIDRAGHDRGHMILSEALLVVGSDRASVDADAQREAVLARDPDEVGDLLLHGLVLLVVVQVAGVVAQLVDEGRDLLRQPVVLLQIDREQARRLRPNLRERVDVGLAVDGDPDHVCPSRFEDPHLPQRGGDVAGLGGGHRLDGDGGRATDLEVADLDRAGLARGDHRGGAPRGATS